MRCWTSSKWLCASLLLASCKAEQKTPPPTQPTQATAATTVDLLAQGAPQACTAADVKQTLLTMITPDTSKAKALANAGTYPFHSTDVDGFAAAINLDLQLVTLAAVDKAVRSVTCDGQVAIAAPAYKIAASSPINVEYQVRPSIDDPTNFIISGKTGLAKKASQDILNQILQQITAHETEAASQKAFAQAAASAPTLPATSPSFDCGRVTSAVLRTICGNDDLIALDNRLTAAYKVALAHADETGDDDARTALISAEREWINRRQQCTDTQCIRDAYDERLQQLSS